MRFIHNNHSNPAWQDVKPCLQGTWNGTSGRDWGTGSWSMLWAGVSGGLQRAWGSRRWRRDIPTDTGLEGARDGNWLEGATDNGLVAIPPNSYTEIQLARAGWRVATSVGDKTNRNKQKLKKKKKLNEVSGHCLLCRSGLLSRCTQWGGTISKLKITVFNIGKARQGNSRQGKAHRNTRSNK